MADDSRPRKLRPPPSARRRFLQTWLLRVGSSILIWTVLMQLTTVADVWKPRIRRGGCQEIGEVNAVAGGEVILASRRPAIPLRAYKSNGYLRVSCNGGLNQMRAAICDMVTIARYLNLTLVIPELDKRSFWADPSDFGDIFNTNHFIASLRDEILSLVRKHKIVHFNKTDARLANNGLPIELQKLRCHVNYEALWFTPQIEELGGKLISILQKSGSFVVLHLHYEMDMLAFSGCSHGCSNEETRKLTRMRYAYPWWKEKEIESERKRLDGLCLLTPEETALVLQALGLMPDTQIYIASGEIYGGDRRMATLRAAYPKIVRKEMLLSADELRPFHNHSTQMEALDYLVFVASDVFVPSYDGNMARVMEGYRRFAFLLYIAQLLVPPFLRKPILLSLGSLGLKTKLKRIK